MLEFFLLLSYQMELTLQILDFMLKKKKIWQKFRESIPKLKKEHLNDKKALKVLCRVHERISNKREDFTQKLSKSLVKNYGIICFEDLNIKNMVKDPIYAKHIWMHAWNKLVTYTSYKAENAGRKVILVDPRILSKCVQLVECW